MDLVLFSTTAKADFVAKLLISGILSSISVTLVLKSVFFLTKLVTSGIFLSILSILSSKSDPSFSYLVLVANFVLSRPFTLATNLSYSVFLVTSFLTTLLNLAKSTGTVFNLSSSILSTSVFKLAKFDFSAKLLTSKCDTFFKSVFVAELDKSTLTLMSPSKRLYRLFYQSNY